jgi:hypothetical protein
MWCSRESPIAAVDAPAGAALERLAAVAAGAGRAALQRSGDAPDAIGGAGRAGLQRWGDEPDAIGGAGRAALERSGDAPDAIGGETLAGLTTRVGAARRRGV